MWGYAFDAGRLAVAAALLVAGASKLVSPRPLATSLGQVFGWARPAGIAAARVVAAIELLAACLLAAGGPLIVGLALTGLVGAGIVVFVSAAMRRGATAPCGCFGESSGRPIGVRNLLGGIGFLAGAGGLLILPGPGTATAELMLPLTATVALAAVMVRDRARLLAPFRRHFRNPTEVP
ncbi:MAG TPA: MauE/DoxX family redox-associated membrane protein [Candidatus Limnocylindrales bacterium]